MKKKIPHNPVVVTYAATLWVPPSHNGNILIQPVQLPEVVTVVLDPNDFHFLPRQEWRETVRPILNDAWDRFVESYLKFIEPVMIHGKTLAKAGCRTCYKHYFDLNYVIGDVKITRKW